MSVTNKDKENELKKLKKLVSVLHRRNKTDVNQFINLVYVFEDVTKSSKHKIKELDPDERENILEFARVYLDGIKILKKIKYPFSSRLERIYIFLMKIC